MSKKLIAAVGLGVSLAFAAPDSAQAQTQDGLVNVAIGDVTILEDVNIAVIANVLANVCASVPVNLTLLASQVDNRGVTRLVCRTPDGQRVFLTQN